MVVALSSSGKMIEKRKWSPQHTGCKMKIQAKWKCTTENARTFGVTSNLFVVSNFILTKINEITLKQIIVQMFIAVRRYYPVLFYMKISAF
jgi:hypothetical protein